MKRDSDSFYKSTRWKRLRAKILSRDKYLDQELKRVGIFKQAEMVHHIFPREIFPEYELSAWNLVSLTNKTHNELHDRTTNELTEKGKALLRRTARKYSVEIPAEYLEKKEKKINSNWRR